MTTGTLLVLGTGPGAPDAADPDPGSDATDLLGTADAVFTGPPGTGPSADPEATALFYAEAWRVERILAGSAASRLAAWFEAHPGGTAALLVAGPVRDEVAFGAALDGLVRLRPGLVVDRRPGVGVTPPHRTTLNH